MTDSSEFSVAPITDDQLVAWPRVAAIAVMVAFALPVFVAGLEIYQGLSFVDTMLALLIGSVVLTVIGAVMGSIGARTRLSSYLLVRIAFGDRGAAVVNMAFAVSLVGWFGVNIDLFSGAVVRLAADVFGAVVPAWPIEIAAGILMTTTTVFGFRAINLIASALAPILAVVTVMLIWGTFESHSLGELMAMEKTPTLTIGDGVSAVVGGIIIGAIILPDITRFIRQWHGAIYVAFWAYMVVELVVFAVAGMAGAASGKTEILDVLLHYGLGVGAFAIVIAGSWVLNSLNLYSTVLSVEATFPKLKGTLITAVLGALGVVAAFMNILDSFLAFLGFLAVIFVPVAGVIITDYLLIKRSRYTAEALTANRPIAVKAVVAWVVGALVAALINEGIVGSVLGVGVLDSAFLSALMFGALSWGDRTTNEEIA
ncbi:purine-cytosine permease family protein [Kordiimonas aquimaris]|uniref:purine-cytosine permease family protein n=1 Tax=Kordiimonas aquimaris TaxID=707591 RepID=UPI0021D37341|nr:cytosine permease [Kordiimonas aquimaris]